jgi:hypothetical protein
MKRSLMMTTAMVMVSGTMALAQVTPDDLGKKYREKGFDYVDVRVGPNQIKVEAYGFGQEVETIYDRQTGRVLETETYGLEGNPNGTGVRIRNVDSDFLDENDITDGIDGPSDDTDGMTDGTDGPTDDTDGNDGNDGTDGNDGPSDNGDDGGDNDNSDGGSD